MTQGQTRGTVALIVLIGHIAVFFAGMLLGIFGPLRGVDVVQTVLMACPVIGATAMSALTYILGRETAEAANVRVSSLFAFVVILFPVCLLVAVFFTFYFLYIQVQGFGPDNMKITLGGIETVFGTYLGAISTKLFGGTGQTV